MQPDNVEEYKGLRSELQSLKDCITTYVGFVVGGAATAFWGLGGRMADDESQRLALAFVAIILAIVATLVLRLLTYKFTSHNRYAGYCKLLTHERYSGLSQGGERKRDLFCWEICVDRLRDLDTNESLATALIAECDKPAMQMKSVSRLAEQLRRVLGPHPPSDEKSIRKGFTVMISASRDDPGSWRFPLHVARVFGAINAVFVAFAMYLAGLLHFRGLPAILSRHVFMYVAFSVVVLVLLILWIGFFDNLHRLMAGSETVEAFCWKFVPIRRRFLDDLGCSNYELKGVSQDAVGTQAASP